MGLEKLFEMFADLLRHNALVRFLVEVSVVWYILCEVLSKLQNYLQRNYEILPDAVVAFSLIVSLLMNSAYHWYIKSKGTKATSSEAKSDKE